MGGERRVGYNEVKKEDEEGEITFTGGSEEIFIDYVLGDQREKVEKMKVGDEMESDHQSVSIWIGRRREREREKREEE